MWRWFTDLRIRSKFAFLAVLVALCFSGVLVWIMSNYQRSVVEDKQAQRQRLVESKLGIVEVHAARAEAGEVSGVGLGVAVAQRIPEIETRTARCGRSRRTAIDPRVEAHSSVCSPTRIPYRMTPL
jgi:hypothetical protein